MSQNLNWMYEGKNSSIDHEQYLLGKKITNLNDDDEGKGDFSISQQSSIATGNVTVLERLDYESKVREDPLFEIKKNDYEHRKELLSNPLKKKRLQSRLRSALEKDLRKKVTADSSSSESSETSSDSDVGRKYMGKSLKDKKLREALKKQLKKDLDNQIQPKKGKHHHHSSNQQRRTKLRRQSSSCSDDDGRKSGRRKQDREQARNSGYGLTRIKDGERKPVETRPRKRRMKATPSPEPEKPKYNRKHRPGFSRKLSEKDLERKRREMMENATWRDDQRKLNVRKFNIEEKKEREKEAEMLRHKAEKGERAKDFLHNVKLHRTSVGSVEDTIRRKKHTLSKV